MSRFLCQNLKCLLVGFCLFGMSDLSGQLTFSISPNPAFGPLNSNILAESKAEAEIKNLLNKVDTFYWKREILLLQDSGKCFVFVEDRVTHYFPHVSARSFSLDSNKSGPLNIGLLDPQETGCCAIVQLKLIAKSNPKDTATVVYNLRECVNAADEIHTKNSIKIYPSLIEDYFSINMTDNLIFLKIYDSFGQLKDRFSIEKDNRFLRNCVKT